MENQPDYGAPAGLVQPGNINLTGRPILHNPDGTISSEKSFSIGTDKGETLLPLIVNGKELTQQQAIDHYRQTGEHMGIFDTPANADAYATQVHNRKLAPSGDPVYVYKGASMLPQNSTADSAQTILAPVQASDSDKALAWEAFHGSSDENELATKLNSMGLPDSVKAGLWEAKRQQKVHYAPGTQPQTAPSPGVPLSYGDTIQAGKINDVLSGFVKSGAQTGRSALAPNGSPSALGKMLSSMLPGFAKEGAGQAGIGDNPDPQNPVAPGLQVDKQTGYDPLAPTGAAQKTGAGIEQALEMLLMGKVVPGGSSLAAKMLSSGGQAGADASLHNQDPRIAGALGGIAGAMSPLAQKVTGAALNTSPQQAKIVLSELTGITPKTISQQAATKSLGLTRQMEQMATDADAQFAAANLTPQANTAYRVRNVGETGIMPNGSHAHATMDPAQAQSYVAGRQAAQNAPQEVVKVDLSNLKQGIDYTPVNGGQWIKFNSAIPESAITKIPAGAASTQPALDVLDREMQKAITQNNQPYYDQLGKIKNQLTTEFTTGDPIGQAVPAKKILDLKRGIGGLINSWDAPARNQTRSVIKEVYGALDSSLDKAAPGISDVNDMIHNLIGVKTAAAKTAKQTSGAAFLNSMRRGEYGAIATRPLSSPTAFVAGARAVNSPVTQSGVKGLALQLANYPQLQQALSDANALPPENQ